MSKHTEIRISLHSWNLTSGWSPAADGANDLNIFQRLSAPVVNLRPAFLLVCIGFLLALPALASERSKSAGDPPGACICTKPQACSAHPDNRAPARRCK